MIDILIKSFLFTVAPTIVDPVPASIVGLVRGTVALVCNATGYPRPNVEWLKENDVKVSKSEPNCFITTLMWCLLGSFHVYSVLNCADGKLNTWRRVFAIFACSVHLFAKCTWLGLYIFICRCLETAMKFKQSIIKEAFYLRCGYPAHARNEMESLLLAKPVIELGRYAAKLKLH